MGKIRILPELIANKIAAGEVIERPCSVVKELIENSLDAGAKAIDVVVENGGRRLIRVSDDGSGIDREDTAVAFERHATSKVTALEDLERIGSFGFRGEALGSIAAVSRVRLITRAEDSSTGTEVVIEGGNLLGIQDHPCRKGTILEVRDLFFNTPARRKFLRSDSTELGQILEVVSRLALSALRVRFTLTASEKTLLDLNPTDQLLIRAREILGGGRPLAGEEANQFLTLDRSRDGIRLWGLLGKPPLTRANRSQIQIFVNRRWVRSIPLSYALINGYHGLLMEGRYPVAALFVDLDLSRVDVNVHPTKQEVRISNESEIASLLAEAVRDCLAKAPDLAPSLLPLRRGPADQTYRLKAAPSETKTWGTVFDRPEAFPIGSSEVSSGKPILLRDSLRITRIVGQIHRTFLVAETEEGWMMIDQHAAHERVMFEQLLKNLRSAQAERQPLLLEEVLELPPKDRARFEESIPMLTKVGFEIEPFGEGAYVIRAVPAVFAQENPVALLQTFLEEQEEIGSVRTRVDDQPASVAALLACKRESVKANEPMAPEAIRALLTRLAQCENPFTCPHGRPVFFIQSISELEKQFKR